jgi:transposase
MGCPTTSAWCHQGEFCSPPAMRELRDLTRYRQKLIQEESSQLNRLKKFLEAANVKLASVVPHIHGQLA